MRSRAIAAVSTITSLIALVLLAGSVVVERQLRAHRGYAALINVAGRQRMLSQRLAKTAVELASHSRKSSTSALIEELDSTVRAWREADDLLAHGEVSHAKRPDLALVHPLLDRISTSAKGIATAYGNGREPSSAEVSLLVQEILNEEPQFLSLMDHLVNEYERDAEAQLAGTEQIQILSSGGALVLILFLCWFGFRPVLLRNARLLEESTRERECALQALACVAIENEEKNHVARELRESEAKIRGLLEAIPDAISCYDAGLRYLYVNPVMAQLRGLPAGAFTGSTDRELGVTSALCELWERDMRKAWETKLPQVTHFDFPSPRGPLQCMARTVPRLRPDGSVQDLLVVTRDVTQVRETETSLEAQKHFLERLILTLPELIYVEDVQTGKVTYANRNLFHLLGYEVDYLNRFHNRNLELIHPDDRASRSRLRESLMKAEDGQLLRADYRCRHADGSWRWLSTWVTVFARAADGTPTQIIGSAQDVTERVASDERFRVLFERSSDAHLLLDHGGIIDCNEAAMRMLGCPDKERLLALHPSALSPEYQPDGRRSSEKAVEMDALAHLNGHHRFDWMHRRADGTDFPFEVTLTPVQIAGKPVLLSVLHDLTERKRAEQELFESKRFIEKIASTVPCGIFVHDNMSHRNVFCNEANAAMFGYSLSEFNALPNASIAVVHPDEFEKMGENMQALQSLGDNETIDVEFRGLHKSGKILWIGGRLTVFARSPQGEVTQYLGVGQDITTRRKAEAALTFQAMNDALTALPNRRAFFERLSGEMERSYPGENGVSPRPLTICICDIDRFKQVNDGHGHHAGDEVLVAFSRVIREEIRQTDCAARLGGDEFSICFPGARIEDASVCIERIRRRIESTPFRANGNSFSVTVSFGLSQWNYDRDMDGLMEAADQTLYSAKGQSRTGDTKLHLLGTIDPPLRSVCR
jgi:diguanylate cyclase (GGDEF)-like protein/PAS domain S-box-containing protein